MNELNNYELSIEKVLTDPKFFFRMQIKKTELNEHFPNNPLLKSIISESLNINDLINLNDSNFKNILTIKRDETELLIKILSKHSLSQEELDFIISAFEQYLTFSEIVQFCHSSHFSEIIDSINQKNKKISAANIIHKIQIENNFEMDMTEEDLEILKNLQTFHKSISQFLKFPSGKKGNMLLNYFIYELNIIGKHNYPDNNVTGFLIPVLKELKEHLPDQFHDLKKFSKEYLLKRARDWKNTDNLDKLKE